MNQNLDGIGKTLSVKEEDRVLSWPKKAVIYMSLIAWTAYLSWRVAYTINWANPIYSITFLACEFLGYISFIRFSMITMRMRKRTPAPIRTNPTVDVLIPTYNEDPDILVQTIYHCMQMDYPHETYVLDDGNRPEIAKLAEQFGAKYITRTNNQHGKAGNLNNALKHCKGDMVAILDADGIPRKDFLTRLLGYFNESDVALVQVPQTFYNLDSFQHVNDRTRTQIWHEQALFFEIIMGGLDYNDVAMCCGSGSIIRRSALDKIGGITTGTVTEDVHMTLRLNLEGFRSVYHDEPLAFCLAPASINEYVTQRARWALGNIQILRQEWLNILTAKKLSLKQKFFYVTPIYYITAFQKLIYYAAPFCYLAFDISPFETNDWFTTAFIANTILNVSAFKVLARGRGRVMMHEVFFLYTLVPYIKSVFKGFLPVDWKFKVTSKKAGGSKKGLPLQLTMSSAVVIGLSLSGFILGLIGIAKSSLDLGAVVAAYFAWHNMVIGSIAMRNSLKKPSSSESYSFFDYRPMQIKRVNDQVVDHSSVALATTISEKGLVCVHTELYPVGTKVGVVLSLPDIDLILDTKVIRSEPIVKAGQAPFFQAHLQYQNMSREEHLELIRYFFEDATPRVFSLFDRKTAAPAAKQAKNQRIGERVQSLVPVYVESLDIVNQDSRTLGLLVDISLKGARVKFPNGFSVGEKVRVQMPWYNGTVTAKVVRCVQESGQMNPPCDVGFEFDEPILLTREQKDSMSELNASLKNMVSAA